MYVLILQRCFIPTSDNLNDDGRTVKEAVIRAERVQDLIHVLDKFYVTPYQELGTCVERFFEKESPLFDYKRPPDGDYFHSGAIVDMTTLGQRIHEVITMAEKKTIEEWDNLLANTIEATTLLPD